ALRFFATVTLDTAALQQRQHVLCRWLLVLRGGTGAEENQGPDDGEPEALHGESLARAGRSATSIHAIACGRHWPWAALGLRVPDLATEHRKLVLWLSSGRPDSFLSLRSTPTDSRRGAKSVRGARLAWRFALARRAASAKPQAD